MDSDGDGMGDLNGIRSRLDHIKSVGFNCIWISPCFESNWEDGGYDTAFSDFWSGVDDGLDLYLRFMAKTARFAKTKHSYWIETCFMEYFFRPVLIRVLMEQITGKKIIMPEVSGRIRKVQNRFETYLKTKNDRITSPEELTLLFTNESMISLMRDFAVKDPMRP